MNNNTYKIQVQDMQTGKIKTVSQQVTPYRPDNNVDILLFYWTEGNASCDCNRALIPGFEIEKLTCGNTRYKIKIFDPQNKVIFVDKNYE